MTNPSGDDNTTGDKMDSLSWPDPSRPIISNNPGYGQQQSPPPMMGPPPPMGHRPTYRRPRWPMVVAILLIVMVLVGAMGIWVF